MFLGLYNYTTYLTYLNLLSGFCGIGFAVYGKYIYSLIFLLLSGICDMFDGLISRMKKNRTLIEKRYGVQIDSLADMISFGFLPIFINHSLTWNKDKSQFILLQKFENEPYFIFLIGFFWSLYLLAALIRLAYYNVLTESNNIKTKKFIGVPVTTAAIIFPFLGFLKENSFITKQNDWFWFWIHFICMTLLTFLFLCNKITLKKPKAKKTIILIGLVGFVWVVFLLCSNYITTQK
ncbi:phosphatidylcholine/phosphatidylserine synthase [Candidatus Phytoplasma solani]|uniref:CDP-alcohol phosphatidyltransferase family protein n=1 Tax=Candidatus Phytoplasma solani TaxID=69896 RepID=UPI0035902CAB